MSSTLIKIQNGHANPTPMVWSGNTYKVYANSNLTSVNIYTNDGTVPTEVDSNTCVCNISWDIPPIPTSPYGSTFLMGPINNGTYSIRAGTRGQTTMLSQAGQGVQGTGFCIGCFLILQGYEYGSTTSSGYPSLMLNMQNTYMNATLTWFTAGGTLPTGFSTSVAVPTTGWYITIRSASSTSVFYTVKISQIN